MRRIVAAGAVAVGLAGAGVAASYLALRPHHAHTIRGQTTREYTPSAVPPPPEPGVAWPTYGYDQERSRAAPFALRPPFRRRWVFHGRSLLEFPPAVGYGRLYLTTFNGRLVAIDSATGRVRWDYRSRRCGWASPALDREIVFVTFIGDAECGSDRRDGQVAAFDARTGRLRWRRETGPTESSPLVLSGTVYVGDWNGRVWALDERTGQTRWTTELHGAIKGSLATSGRRLYIGTYGGQVACLDVDDGRIFWSSRGHGSFYSSPAVAYGRIYVGSLDGGVYAFGATTGALLWSRATGGYVYASPAVWNRLVLVGSYDHRFYALDAGTGDVRWSVEAGAPISGSASVIGGVVWFSSFDGHTYALEARDGRRLTSWPDGKYSPAVADSDRLYLVGLGRLYALEPVRGQRAPRPQRSGAGVEPTQPGATRPHRF